MKLPHNSLLRTGNNRIEHYYEEIYRQAERQREEAEGLRNSAQRDRQEIRNVEIRIYDMAEIFVQDHLKWVFRKLRPDPENYQRTKLDLREAFDFVESVGYDLPKEIRKDSLAKLKEYYRAKVREERDKTLEEAEKQEYELQRRLE